LLPFFFVRQCPHALHDTYILFALRGRQWWCRCIGVRHPAGRGGRQDRQMRGDTKRRSRSRRLQALQMCGQQAVLQY
jgi:hypothetical protein